MIYISQCYFDTRKIIRLNYYYFWFFKCCNPKEIDTIRQNHAFALKKEKFVNYFNPATKNPGLIDLKINNESFKYRQNLDIRLVKFA